MGKKHPIKRLDTFKLYDWVIETNKYLPNALGQIVGFVVKPEFEQRYVNIRDTEGGLHFADINAIRHLEPELAILLTGVNK